MVKIFLKILLKSSMDSNCTSAFIHNIFTFPFNDFFFNSPPHGNLKSRLVQFSSAMAFIYLQNTTQGYCTSLTYRKSEQERAKQKENTVQTKFFFQRSALKLITDQNNQLKFTTHPFPTRSMNKFRPRVEHIWYNR